MAINSDLYLHVYAKVEVRFIILGIWYLSSLAGCLIFLNFILLFEFLLILLDPYIEVLSDRQPILVFAANFVLALIVFPIHQFIHGFAEKRLLKD